MFVCVWATREGKKSINCSKKQIRHQSGFISSQRSSLFLLNQAMPFSQSFCVKETFLLFTALYIDNKYILKQPEMGSSLNFCTYCNRLLGVSNKHIFDDQVLVRFIFSVCASCAFAYHSLITVLVLLFILVILRESSDLLVS